MTMAVRTSKVLGRETKDVVCYTNDEARYSYSLSHTIMYSAHMQTNHALEDMNIDMLVLVDKYLHTYLPPLPVHKQSCQVAKRFPGEEWIIPFQPPTQVISLEIVAKSDYEEELRIEDGAFDQVVASTGRGQGLQSLTRRESPPPPLVPFHFHLDVDQLPYIFIVIRFVCFFYSSSGTVLAFGRDRNVFDSLVQWLLTFCSG